MKPILLTSLAFCFLVTTFAQSKPSSLKTEKTVNLLCQKWVFTKMSTAGESRNLPASEATYLTFRTDGSYTDSSARFNVSHGTWLYDGKTQFLEMIDKGGKTKTKVVKLTRSELTMEMKYPTTIIIATYHR